MQKKAGYRLFRNSQYALAGLWDMLRTETSFRLELCVCILLWIALPAIPIPTEAKMILGLSLFVPIIAETVNSAIERTVDLVTQEYHEQAKRAKDVGSAVVFLSILFTGLVWWTTLHYSSSL
jgi:diacylglycerol kinase (ATP)